MQLSRLYVESRTQSVLNGMTMGGVARYSHLPRRARAQALLFELSQNS
ncbi:hypothetical protein ALP71_00891 [Pseudomonas coronafaciens pv. garcae]|nr:hypothetical protein ALP71_00891 [Pseudomonas coronafaciens pv. garcae]